MQTQVAWAQQLDHSVETHFQQMVSVRRHLHAHPELSGNEYQTTAFLAQQLRAAGLHAQPVPGGRGLVVDGPDATDGPRIGLRADIDAIAIADTKSVDYRSRVPGVMHACGHDAHAAVVSGAALSLAMAQEKGVLPWPVRWRAIFQPAEETGAGALQMIEAGALQGVAAVLSLHVDPSRLVHRVGLRTGPFTADCVELEVHVRGRGGHASRPHESLDPIAAAAQLVSSIYLFVPRAIDTHDPVVVTIGHIAGGHSFNVIPDHVVLRGTVRTMGGATRQAAVDHIRQLARGLAQASGTSMDVRFRSGPPPVINDPQLTQLLEASAVEVVGIEAVESIARPSMGGEDFANYLAHVPGSMFRLGCVSSPQGAAPLHSPQFDIDERALAVGAKILAHTAVHWCSPARQADSSLSAGQVR